MMRWSGLVISALAAACGNMVDGAPDGGVDAQGSAPADTAPGTLAVRVSDEADNAWSDFGASLVGSKGSTVLKLTLTNEGPGPVTIDESPTFNGAASADYFLLQPVTYATLAPGETADALIGYRPRATGARDASVAIVSDSATPTAEIPLHGTSSCPTAPPYDLELPGATEACGRMVMVAGGSHSARISSKDGIVWGSFTQSVPGASPAADKNDDGVSSIMIGMGRIVAVADSGFYLSEDGATTWRKLPPPLPQDWGQGSHSTAGTFAHGLFVVVGGSRSWTSSDGVSWNVWTHAFPDGSGGPQHWGGLAYGNGKFVAAGDAWTQVSDDGVTWHDITKWTGVSGYWSDIAFTNGLFMAVGDDCCSTGNHGAGRRATSPDGVTWSPLAFNETAGAEPLGATTRLTVRDDTFYVSAGSKIKTTKDGVSFSVLSGSSGLGSIAYANGHYLGDQYSGKIYHSTDASVWKLVYQHPKDSSGADVPGIGSVGIPTIGFVLSQ